MIGYICLAFVAVWALTGIFAFRNMIRFQKTVAAGDPFAAMKSFGETAKMHAVLGGICFVSGIGAVATFIWFLVDKYAG